MDFKHCRGCGIPLQMVMLNRWRDDGILESRIKSVRGILVERELFTGIISSIHEALGISIDHIIEEAKRRDTRQYVDEVMSGALGSVLRFAPFRRYGYFFMVRMSESLGFAKSRIVEYRPGRMVVGRAEHVYHEALFAGDVCGTFESLDRKRGKARYGYVDDIYYLEITPDTNGREEDERLRLERIPPVPAEARFDRCGKCGYPLRVNDFRWKPHMGKIVDRLTGEWLIGTQVDGINAVMRALEDELGEEIPRLIADFTRDFYQELMNRHEDTPFSDLVFMKVRGMGVPENDEPSPGQLASGLKVRNAFNAPIVAGTVAAVCGSGGSSFEWEVPEPGIVTVRLEA